MAMEIIRSGRWLPDRLVELKKNFDPKSQLGMLIRDALKYLPIDMAADLIDQMNSVVVFESALSIVHFVRQPNGLYFVQDHGKVSNKVVTTAGVNFLVDAWQGIVEPEIMKYHGIGTSSTSESTSDTSLGSESTTALNPDSTRATGSLTEGGAANVFRSVGTLTADASIAAVEHGLFSQAATGGGTLWDRSVFSVINLVSGDSIQITYDLTANAGG